MVRQKPAKLPFPSSNLGATLLFSAHHTMLYLVATPIGNLSDITFRAIEILKSCDYILCEDTHHSQHLLHHYQIHKPLQSYHKFNEAATEQQILHDLTTGKQIALISDAGTPGISDPGARLVKLCTEHHISVTSIPGPCAAIQALAQSGLDTDRFQFWGFLPKKEGDLRRSLQEILSYAGTTICYESPNRLLDVLQLLDAIAPTRHLVVCRELTKKFEETQRGTAKALWDHWQHHPLKGEIVLLIAGCPEEEKDQWADWTPLEHVDFMVKTYNLKTNDAIKIVAEMRGIPKRDLYKERHQDS